MDWKIPGFEANETVVPKTDRGGIRPDVNILDLPQHLEALERAKENEKKARKNLEKDPASPEENDNLERSVVIQEQLTGKLWERGKDQVGIQDFLEGSSPTKEELDGAKWGPTTETK